MKTKSTKFRIYVVLSVVWAVIVLLSVTGNARDYWDFSDYAIPFTIFTAPVWILWSSVWVWPSKFDAFFDPKPNSKDLKQWVNVDETTAKTHPYYGVGGWAILITIGLFLAPIRILSEFYTQDVNFDDVAHISGFMALYRAEEIINWLLSGLSLITAYCLLSHKAGFQKLYLTLVLVSIFVPIVDAVAVIDVFENSGVKIGVNDLFSGQEIFRQIAVSIASLLWVMYVFRSKRINITTRKRLRKKHMHLLSASPGNA